MEEQNNMLCYEPDYCFNETRVALVVDNLTDKDFNPNTCSNKQFYDRAQGQGTAYSLKEFEKLLTSGEFNYMYKSLPSTEYLFVRFVRFYKDRRTDEVVLSEERPEAM